MLLLLCGHPRSGTELLTRLCATHPEIFVTLELGTFRTLWVPPKIYSLALLDGFRSRKFPIVPAADGRWRGWRAWWGSYRFLLVYLWKLREFRFQTVGPEAVERCYAEISGATVVGDKLPDYCFCLDQFAHIETMRCVVMHRHPYCVIRSYLELLQGNWKHIPTLNRYASPRAIAERWALSVGQIRRHQERVLALSYERLLEQPEAELARLADWLGVPASGFDRGVLARPRSPAVFVGRERDQILQVAAAEMEYLGYLG